SPRRARERRGSSVPLVRAPPRRRRRSLDHPTAASSTGITRVTWPIDSFGKRPPTPGPLRRQASRATMPRTTMTAITQRAALCDPTSASDRIALQGTGHAVPAAAALAELEAGDLDDVDPGRTHL